MPRSAGWARAVGSRASSPRRCSPRTAAPSPSHDLPLLITVGLRAPSSLPGGPPVSAQKPAPLLAGLPLVLGIRPDRDGKPVLPLPRAGGVDDHPGVEPLVVG